MTAFPATAVGCEANANESTPPPPTAAPLAVAGGALTIPEKNGVHCTGASAVSAGGCAPFTVANSDVLQI